MGGLDVRDMDSEQAGPAMVGFSSCHRWRASSRNATTSSVRHISRQYATSASTPHQPPAPHAWKRRPDRHIPRWILNCFLDGHPHSQLQLRLSLGLSTVQTFLIQNILAIDHLFGLAVILTVTLVRVHRPRCTYVFAL